MTKPAPFDWRMLWRDFWRAPHRPLMVCAVLAALGGPFFAGVDPAAHARLMTFGFAGAVIGAYLLTVLPGWTGVRASPRRIALLTLLWWLGRLFPGPTEALFFVLLLGTLLPPVFKAKLWDRIWAPVGAGLLAIASVSPDLENGVPPLLIAALIAVIGGRAIPSFLASAADVDQPRDHLILRVGAAFLLLGAALMGNVAWYYAAAGALLVQFVFWPLRVPSIGLILLPPWLWLILALVLLAFDQIGASQAMHVLTMGAIGGMIHAFMSRVFADRVEGGLVARPASVIAAFALHVSVIARLGDHLDVAYMAWTLAWGITLLQLFRHLCQPHKIPVFIGSRRRNPKKQTS